MSKTSVCSTATLLKSTVIQEVESYNGSFGLGSKRLVLQVIQRICSQLLDPHLTFFLDEAGLHETGMETVVITDIGVLKITMQFRFPFL